MNVGTTTTPSNREQGIQLIATNDAGGAEETVINIARPIIENRAENWEREALITHSLTNTHENGDCCCLKGYICFVAGTLLGLAVDISIGPIKSPLVGGFTLPLLLIVANIAKNILEKRGHAIRSIT